MNKIKHSWAQLKSKNTIEKSKHTTNINIFKIFLLKFYPNVFWKKWKEPNMYLKCCKICDFARIKWEKPQ